MGERLQRLQHKREVLLSYCHLSYCSKNFPHLNECSKTLREYDSNKSKKAKIIILTMPLIVPLKKNHLQN